MMRTPQLVAGDQQNFIPGMRHTPQRAQGLSHVKGPHLSTSNKPIHSINLYLY